MVFVVGGAFQGKTAFAMEKFNIEEQDFLDGIDCEIEDIYGAKLINHFDELVRRLLIQGVDVEQVVERLIRENENSIIIMNEIGCGLVPVDSFEREYREKTGRIGCKLAKVSNEVYRVYCGIATEIKASQVGVV
jgi:adenosyl cobinamide kinase/adenosyl cobinamide phosphate guanylyltransferase